MKNYADKDQVSGRDYSAKNLREAYRLAAEKIGWSSRTHNGAPRTEAHLPFITKKRGIGMASQIWGGGGGPPAYSVVKVNGDGTAQVLTGGQDIGTGTRTGLAQIAAEALDFPLERVQVSVGDSQSGYYAPVSAGSRTLASIGPAVRSAAADAQQQLIVMAAELFKLPTERVKISEGFAIDTEAPDQRKSIAEILSTFNHPMVIGKGSRSQPQRLRTQDLWRSIRRSRGGRGHGAGSSAAGCCRPRHWASSQPQIGAEPTGVGIIQGIGYALTEKRQMDSQTGRVLNPDFEEYLVPTSMDILDIDATALGQVDPHSNNVGSKGWENLQYSHRPGYSQRDLQRHGRTIDQHTHVYLPVPAWEVY